MSLCMGNRAQLYRMSGSEIRERFMRDCVGNHSGPKTIATESLIFGLLNSTLCKKRPENN